MALVVRYDILHVDLYKTGRGERILDTLTTEQMMKDAIVFPWAVKP